VIQNVTHVTNSVVFSVHSAVFSEEFHMENIYSSTVICLMFVHANSLILRYKHSVTASGISSILYMNTDYCYNGYLLLLNAICHLSAHFNSVNSILLKCLMVCCTMNDSIYHTIICKCFILLLIPSVMSYIYIYI